MKKLLSRKLLDASRMFATDGEIQFKRLSPVRFAAPLYHADHFFRLYANGFDIKLQPMSLIVVASKPLVSVRDLLSPTCLLTKAYFTCYCDPAITIDRLKVQADVGIQSGNNLYSLNCKAYTTKYDKFYNSLLPGAERRHIILRVGDVSIVAAHRNKSS